MKLTHVLCLALLVSCLATLAPAAELRLAPQSTLYLVQSNPPRLPAAVQTHLQQLLQRAARARLEPVDSLAAVPDGSPALVLGADPLPDQAGECAYACQPPRLYVSAPDGPALAYGLQQLLLTSRQEDRTLVFPARDAVVVRPWAAIRRWQLRVSNPLRPQGYFSNPHVNKQLSPLLFPAETLNGYLAFVAGCGYNDLLATVQPGTFAQPDEAARFTAAFAQARRQSGLQAKQTASLPTVLLGDDSSHALGDFTFPGDAWRNEVRRIANQSETVSLASVIDANPVNDLYALYVAGQLLLDPAADPEKALHTITTGIWGPVQGQVVADALLLLQQVRRSPGETTVWLTDHDLDPAQLVQQADALQQKLAWLPGDEGFVAVVPLPWEPAHLAQLLRAHLQQTRDYAAFQQKLGYFNAAVSKGAPADALQPLLDRLNRPLWAYDGRTGPQGFKERREQETLLRELAASHELTLTWPARLVYQRRQQLVDLLRFNATQARTNHETAPLACLVVTQPPRETPQVWWTLDSLTEVTGLPAADIRAALQSAVDAGLVVSTPQGYRIADALHTEPVQKGEDR